MYCIPLPDQVRLNPLPVLDLSDMKDTLILLLFACIFEKDPLPHCL